MSNNKVGRKTKMTPETIAKLVEAFEMAFTDEEACAHADIDVTTLWRYCNVHEDFAKRKELLKLKVGNAAKLTIAREVMAGDKEMAKWYGETKLKKEFSKRMEGSLDLSGEIKIIPILGGTSKTNDFSTNDSNEESMLVEEEA